MAAPVPVSPGTLIAAATKLEKGGLFVVLLVVLYLGYNIYLDSRKSDQQLIMQQLTTISQQQVNLQQSLASTQAALQANQDSTRDVLRKIEGIEETMIRYVYFDMENQTLVLRTPGANGGAVLQIKTHMKNEKGK